MRFRLPTRGKRNEADTHSPERSDDGGNQVSCPKCNHQFKTPSFSSGVEAHTRLPPAFSAFFLLDNAPAPLLLLSPTFNIVTCNKAASDLFVHVTYECGSLEKLHINELGIEFPDKKQVTLGMFLENRRSSYFPGLRFDTQFEHGDPNQYSPQPSPVEGPANRHTLSESFTPRTKASSVVKGMVLPKSKSVANQGAQAPPSTSSRTESLKVVIRYPRTHGSEASSSKSYTSSTEPVQFITLPATLQISFVEMQNERYVIVWINLQENTSLTNSLSANSISSGGSDLSPRSTSDGRGGKPGTAIEELASRADKMKDSTIENLSSLFIAVSVNGDIAISNGATRRFFGYPPAPANITKNSADWVSRVCLYDASFANSIPFNGWVARTFRRRSVTMESTVGIIVNNVPKIVNVKGEPFPDGTTSPRNGEREPTGYIFTFQNVREKEEWKSLQNREERLRGMFTSGVVAELRTPVAGIVGLLQLLNETDLTQEQVTHVMGLLRSVNSLLITIDDIVDFSTFEIETTNVLKPKTFNLYHMISHVSNLAYHTFSKRDVHFSVDVSGLKPITTMKPSSSDENVSDSDTGRDLEKTRECIVVGDESKAGKVLTNLLSNAFKYTTKGYVNLRVGLIEETEGGYNIGFEVKDTGIGISEEAGKTLFKPLFLSGDARSERKPTDGLGLYVSQKIVSLLNGKIDFFSTLGIGSVFKTSIPFRKDNHIRGMSIEPESTEDLLQATSIMLQNEFNQNRRSSDPLSLQLGGTPVKSETPEPSDSIPSTVLQKAEIEDKTSSKVPVIETPVSETKPESITDKTLMPGLRPKHSLRKDSNNSNMSEAEKQGVISLIAGAKVMVVEDNWALQNITKLRLEKMGCNPIIAVNGLEALRLLSSEQAEPDIILMDLQMPLMDGYEATTKIRNASEPNLARFKNIPIVAVTASTAEEDRIKAFESGMSDYTLKPLGVKVLKELVLKYGDKGKLETEKISSRDPIAQPSKDNNSPSKH